MAHDIADLRGRALTRFALPALRSLAVAAAVGVIVGLVLALRHVVQQDYLAQGLWRTSLWTVSRGTLSGASIGAGSGAVALLILGCWPPILSLCRRLLDMPAAHPSGDPSSLPKAFRFASLFAVCVGAVLLVIPASGPAHLGLAYRLAVVGSLAAAWLMLSGAAAVTASDASYQRRSESWFRLGWLAVVASVWVAAFLRLWASSASGRQAVVPAAAGLLICAAGCLVLYRPARRLSSRWFSVSIGLAATLRLRWLPGLVLAGAIVAWLAGWPVARQARAEATERRRNVVIIAVDTLRADRASLLSEHQHDRDLTPNIRRLLGRRGTIFANAISQSPWTLPAFASVFTGLYPEQHRAEQVTSILAPDQLTLAELLREAGYRTAGVVSGYYVSSQFAIDQGFAEFDESQVLGATAVTSEQVTEKALRFLRGRRDDPFFLFVHYFDPHGTYVAHPGFHYADRYNGWLREEANTEKQHLVVQAKRHLLGPAEYSYLRDLYDEEVAYTDSQVGRLLEFIDQCRMWDSTMVIFLSDHGEEFWEHGALGHRCTVYQEVIRVPLVIADPSRDGQSVIDRPVETRWLFGTILDFLGVEVTNRGVSGPLLLDDAAAGAGPVRSSTRPVLSAQDLGTDSGARVWLSCIVGERWKLIRDHLLERTALYDLANDPAESDDVRADSPEMGRDLAARLAAWDDAVGLGESSVPPVLADEEQIRRLRSLGYL